MIDFGISYTPAYRIHEINPSEFLKRFQVALDSRFDRHGGLRERTKSSTRLVESVVRSIGKKNTKYVESKVEHGPPKHISGQRNGSAERF